jgi:hypothetical protein
LKNSRSAKTAAENFDEFVDIPRHPEVVAAGRGEEREEPAEMIFGHGEQ